MSDSTPPDNSRTWSPLAEDRPSAGDRPSGRPADLRRAGPFAGPGVPSATTEAAGVQGARLGRAAQPGDILRLDDFESVPKTWQRKRKEPEPPRVHPANRQKNTGVYAASAEKARRKGGGRGLLVLILLLAIAGGGYWLYDQYLARTDALTAEAQQKARVLEIERILASLSFDPGIQDGVADSQLQSAVIQFQEFAGLPLTGQITPDFVRELRAVNEMMNGG